MSWGAWADIVHAESQPRPGYRWTRNDEVTSASPDRIAMYITDLQHFLDTTGVIGPTQGPARAMAQFHADVVAYASDATGRASAAPRCFKCKKSGVDAGLAADGAIVWACPNCRTEGRISNWQGTLWDLRDRPAPRS